MRFFNTSGPVVPADHYCIPPLERVDLDDVCQLVRNKRYFVLHAPRQTGKTSVLLALRDLLNSGAVGDYRCVYFNVEVGQAGREDTARAMRAMFRELATWTRVTLKDSLVDEIWPGLLDKFGPDGALGAVLNRWAEADRKPLVLLIDEIDSLVGDTLISVLRQLRAGYVQRPERFPQSVVRCGVRDVRDYRIHSGTDNTVVLGGSAFNIKALSMRLGDLSREEVPALLAQHTGETGQRFTPEALETVWTQTQGQPWLVNALADATCFSRAIGRDRRHTVTVDDIEAAQEQLILSRETHLAQLADKLQEDRVRRVVEPLLSGGDERGFTARDIEYVARPWTRRAGRAVAHRQPHLRGGRSARADLGRRGGACAGTPPGTSTPTAGWTLVKLLAAFQAFFREHSEHWVERFDYREAGPQLLLQAFLRRIVNGGGRIER